MTAHDSALRSIIIMPGLQRGTSRPAAAFALVIAVIAMGMSGCATSPSSDTAAPPGMFAGDDVVSFTVEGMACRNCANEIARELEALPGVRGAMIDFDSSTAKVALDPDPAKAASMDEFQAAVEHWRTEHFSVKEDPDCLDPARREQMQNKSSEE